ncbi:MAG TPA: hypothetical protein VK559_02970 [Ferruginibacter sp.]|nr:hypothetical protein [Ferruginibacter sp.]
MESEMEPDVKEFLVRIMQTISMSVVWLLVNMTLGIYFNFAFFDTMPSIWNYLFYLWFIISFGLLLYYFHTKWKGKL